MSARTARDDSLFEPDPQPPADGPAGTKVNHPDSALVQAEISQYVADWFRDGPGRAPIIDFMTKGISAETAEEIGLDAEEIGLALRYAAAAKKVAQRTLTAATDETTRLKDERRLASLLLDYHLRLGAAASLPEVLTDDRQYDLASQLSSTFYQLQKLEKALFGEPRTPKDGLVTKVDTRRSAYRDQRAKLEPEAEKPTAPRRFDRKPPHLAA